MIAKLTQKRTRSRVEDDPTVEMITDAVMEKMTI
jgi:hypothetical protein